MKTFQKTGLAVSALALGMATAYAQPEERLRQGVLDRDRPAYAARGARIGSFLVYPAVDLSMIYDDNIFATDGGEVDDLIFQANPEIAVESNFPRHSLNFRAEVLKQSYIDEASENRTDYFLGAGARVDIRRAVNFNVEAEYQKDTEDRGSPDVLGLAEEPVDYRRFEVVPELRYRPGRFTGSIGAVIQGFDFDDAPLVGGAIQNNDDRDRNLYGAFGRAAYELSPGYEVFAVGLFSTIDYDQALDDNGFNRDSDGYQFDAGARFEVTNVVAGEVSVGYLSRNYDDPALATVEGVSTEIDFEWYVSRLTTILLGGSRRVQETTIFGASGYLETAVDAGVDHELMRNLILSANVRFSNRSYEGIARDDDQYEISARALYLINRNLSLAGEYRHINRDSTVAGEDYGRNVVFLTLRLQV